MKKNNQGALFNDERTVSCVVCKKVHQVAGFGWVILASDKVICYSEKCFDKLRGLTE